MDTQSAVSLGIILGFWIGIFARSVYRVEDYIVKKMHGVIDKADDQKKVKSVKKKKRK